jgi:hypothetical protein
MEEVVSLAPAETASNWNRLVVTALEEYAARQRRVKLQASMVEMAADPDIRAETRLINKLSRKTARDGLT